VDELYALMPNRTKIQYDADSIAFTTVNGKSYGLASPGSIAKNEGFIIRKDWLDKLGLKAPTNLDELMVVAKAFTENDPDGNGKKDTYGFGAFIENNNFEKGLGRRFDSIAGAFGVEGSWNLTKEGAGLNMKKPAYFDFLVYVKKMMDEGVIDPNWTSYKKDDFRAAWKQGKFGIFREQNAALHSESNYAPFDQNFPNGDLIVIDPPAGPSGKKSVGVYTQAYRIYAMSTSAAKAKKGDDIAKLLEWMSSDEGYYLLGWGEEGVNYVKDANGVPSVVGLPDESKGYSKPEMQPLTQLRNMVYYNGDIELASRYPTYKAPTSGKTMSSLVTLRDMQSRAWTPLIGGDTLVKPDADLDRFMQQSILEFLTGVRKLDKATWDAWVADFDKMGAAAWEKAAMEEAAAKNFLK
jgi:putative aldouronate transport system substrate-binding protein